MIKAEMMASYIHNIPKNARNAFCSSIVFGLIAHLYMFTNKLPNYDDLTGLRAYGASRVLGRWFLWMLGEVRERLLGNYSMPWLNGMFYIFCIAMVSALTVHLLNIRDTVLSALIGGIMVSFAPVMGTAFFMFTAPFYGIALVFAALAVWMFLSEKWYLRIVGCIFGVLSIGIYQAYFPFCAALLVLILLRQLFSEKTFVSVCKNALQYFALLVITVIGYLAITRIFWGNELSSYQGADQMGKLNIAELPVIIKTIYDNYRTFHFGQFNGINSNLLILSGLSMLCICGYIEVGIYAVAQFLHKKRDSILKGLMSLLLVAIFPIAAFGIYLMASHAYVYSLMFYPLVLCFIMPVMLLDQWNQSEKGLFKGIPKMEKIVLSVANVIVVLMLSLSTAGYCHYDNEYYLQIALCEEQTASIVTTWITQIKSLEGYRADMPVAFIGRYHDETYFNVENYFPNTYLAGWSNYVLSNQYLQYMTTYCGYSPTVISDISELSIATEVQEMPCYPTDGSVRIIDDIVVFKFSEP